MAELQAVRLRLSEIKTTAPVRDPWLSEPLTPEEIEVIGRAETEQGEPW